MDINRRIQDREVHVDRKDVIETLKANRLKHIEEFEQALANYPQAVRNAIEEFEKVVEDFNVDTDFGDFASDKWACEYYGDVIATWQPPRYPVNYTEQYDRMIMALEPEVRDVITLTGREVACLLHDQWDWKADFIETVASVNHYSVGR